MILFINNLDIKDFIKQKLLEITPYNYTGIIKDI